MIDLAPRHLAIVQDILRHYLPDREVRVFGSRVTGKVKPYSDLDLAVMGDTPLTLTQLADLTEAFDESDLPWKVDVVDWATTSPSFREIVARHSEVLQSPA